MNKGQLGLVCVFLVSGGIFAQWVQAEGSSGHGAAPAGKGHEAPAAAASGGEKSASQSPKMLQKGVLANLVKDNASFVSQHNKSCFEPFLDKQTPRLTLVGCSDSRFHTYALDETPDNDLFVIRNIGNQLKTAEGSIMYGIHHLNASVLLFLGHTGCGAVKAALGDFSTLAAPIRKEVETIKLSHKKLKTIDAKVWLEGVVENVNNQVTAGMKSFGHEVEEEKLVVVGGVYDLHNAFKKGYGRLVIVNINGETDATLLAKHPLLQGLKAETLGLGGGSEE